LARWECRPTDTSATRPAAFRCRRSRRTNCKRPSDSRRHNTASSERDAQTSGTRRRYRPLRP
jgi:hypothetical protein